MDGLERLNSHIREIKGADKAVQRSAWDRLNELAKPPGSLGVLEDMAARMAGITGNIKNKIDKRRIIVMAADNGVVMEGVSRAPKSVTLMQTANMAKGITGVAVLAKEFGSELEIVDVGIDSYTIIDGVIDRKLMHGTNNIRYGPAMSYDDAINAILVGIERAGVAAEDGVRLVGVGEMGIGNTTTSSAVLSAITGICVDEITGKGCGITDEGYENKKKVIADAINNNMPNVDDPIDVLAKLGGLDIAAMAGIYIGCAHNRIPVVIDGYISMIAALVAYKLAPLSKEYMFASHTSYERGYAVAENAIGLSAPLNLGMRLGEGSGCPLGFMLLQAACCIINNMATFSEGNIADDYLENIKDGDCFTI